MCPICGNPTVEEFIIDAVEEYCTNSDCKHFEEPIHTQDIEQLRDDLVNAQVHDDFQNLFDSMGL